MKYYELNKEEERVVSDFDTDKLIRVKNFDNQTKELGEAVRHTLNKARNINIRLTERDLQKLKSKALHEGIPYQTLASSILHKSADE
jgi:predicted DNA binding CopG/RHH family protein